MKNSIYIFAIYLLFASCSGNGKKSDAYGNFEATEVIISAEASGKLLQFTAEEGQKLNVGDKIGLIDTIQLWYKKAQLIAQRATSATKLPAIQAQINVLKEQKNSISIEKQRIEKLLKDGAATNQQLDNVNGQINVIDKQIESTQIQFSTVNSELQIYLLQIEQIQDQINKSVIINPVNGTVLEKYCEPNEMANMGKSLYKIADLSSMYLRVYVSESELSHIKTGQKVEILIDDNKTGTKILEGETAWISSQGEFTPKIIQTKEERVNWVYAVKIRVKNDGTLHIGMPGEANFEKK